MSAASALAALRRFYPDTASEAWFLERTDHSTFARRVTLDGADAAPTSPD